MIRLSGIARAVPEQIVRNEDLTRYMETSDEWISQRSGIKQRRWFRTDELSGPGPGGVDLATEASRQAIARAGLQENDIEAIIYATINPDSDYPGPGTVLKERLGISRVLPVYEVRNACSGFLYGMMIAGAHLRSGTFRHVLVVGAEVQSTGLNLSTAGRDTAVLFGDGAGAAVFSADKDGRFDLMLESDGSYAQALRIPRPGFSVEGSILKRDFDDPDNGIYPVMDGRLVFKMASSKMPEIIHKLLESTGTSIEEIDLIVPHQANQRIIDMLARELACPARVYSNIERYGNTTAASIPLALSEAIDEGRVKGGDLVCLVAFGAGFSWGAALCSL